MDFSPLNGPLSEITALTAAFCAELTGDLQQPFPERSFSRRTFLSWGQHLFTPPGHGFFFIFFSVTAANIYICLAAEQCGDILIIYINIS